MSFSQAAENKQLSEPRKNSYAGPCSVLIREHQNSEFWIQILVFWERSLNYPISSIRLHLLLQAPPLLKAKPQYFGQLPHSVENEDEECDDVEAKVLHEFSTVSFQISIFVSVF